MLGLACGAYVIEIQPLTYGTVCEIRILRRKVCTGDVRKPLPELQIGLSIDGSAESSLGEPSKSTTVTGAGGAGVSSLHRFECWVLVQRSIEQAPNRQNRNQSVASSASPEPLSAESSETSPGRDVYFDVAPSALPPPSPAIRRRLNRQYRIPQGTHAGRVWHIR